MRIKATYSSATRQAQRDLIAFTLLEVMVAVVVFAILLAAINGVFWGALRLQKRMVESVDAALPAEQALAVIRNDLINITAPGGAFATELNTTLSAGNTNSAGLPMTVQQGISSPQFTTTSGRVDETTYWGDLQRVSYSVSNRELLRTVTRNLLPSMQQDYQQETILTGVENIYFFYHDGTQWKSVWDPTLETLKLPRAIKVQIAMETERGARARSPALELIVPVVDAGTNNLTTASTQ